MKQLLNITILALYMVFSAGVTLSWHYCSGKLEGVSLLSSAAMCDGCADDAGCCHSEEQTLKIEDFQSIASQISAPSVEILAVFSATPPENMEVCAGNTSVYFTDLKYDSPPDGINIPVRDCCFRC